MTPGWWVATQPAGADVWVLNPGMLSAFLNRELIRLEMDELSALADVVASYTRARLSSRRPPRGSAATLVEARSHRVFRRSRSPFVLIAKPTLHCPLAPGEVQLSCNEQQQC